MQMKQYHDKQTSYPHVHFYAGITSDGQIVVVKGTIFEQTTSMLKWDADFWKPKANGTTIHLIDFSEPLAK